MGELMTYKMTRADAGERLDSILSSKMGPRISRSRVQKLIEDGQVKLAGRETRKPGAKVSAGQTAEVFVSDPERLADLVPESIPLDIVHEDADIIVVNKPRGMVVHPARGHHSGTLVNALLDHCADLGAINGTVRPGIVHRLDMDTTGVMVAAKNEHAFQELSYMIRRRIVHREYRTLVVGNLKNLSGSVDAPIGRNPRDRKKMAVVTQGTKRDARTHYRVIERFHGFDLVALKLDTGRTHQIRVHMTHMGFPVVGDKVYGGSRAGLRRGEDRFGDEFKAAYKVVTGQLLHAFKLQFPHPTTKVPTEFSAPLPPDFEALVDFLRANSAQDEINQLLSQDTFLDQTSLISDDID